MSIALAEPEKKLAVVDAPLVEQTKAQSVS